MFLMFVVAMLCIFDLSGEVHVELHLVGSMGTKTLNFLLRLFQVVFQALDTRFQRMNAHLGMLCSLDGNRSSEFDN